MRRDIAEIKSCCTACCCPAPAEPVEPTPPAEEELGPSVVDNPLPLSNGLNIPTLGVLRGYRRYYTRCVYLNPGEVPPPVIAPVLQVGTTNLEFSYYPIPAQRIDVLSYPAVTLEFGENIRTTTVGNVTRAYPTSSDQYYIEFIYTVDGVEQNIISAHYDVLVYGYELPEADGLSLDFTIKAADLSASGKIVMQPPFLNSSSKHIFLNSFNDNSGSIKIKSNVKWRIEFLN